MKYDKCMELKGGSNVVMCPFDNLFFLIFSDDDDRSSVIFILFFFRAYIIAVATVLCVMTS